MNVRIKRGGKGENERGGRVMGRIEEYFMEKIKDGDKLILEGKVMRFEGIRENE